MPFESGQVSRVGSGVEASVVGWVDVEVDLLDLLFVLVLFVVVLLVLLLEDGAVIALFVLLKEVVELVDDDLLEDEEEDMLVTDDVDEEVVDVLTIEVELDKDTVETMLGRADEELEGELTGCAPFCGLIQAEPAHDGPPTVSVSKTGFGSASSPDSLSAPSGVTSSYAKAYPVVC